MEPIFTPDGYLVFNALATLTTWAVGLLAVAEQYSKMQAAYYAALGEKYTEELYTEKDSI